MRMTYRLSPYLIRREDGAFSNLITGKAITMSEALYAHLRCLPSSFTLNEIAAALHIDSSTAASLCDKLLRFHVLLPGASDPSRLYAIRYASIEICSHCNASCEFCPVSREPLPRAFMADEDFELITSKIASATHLTWICLNHYNEPLLDSTFEMKARVLAHYGLPLRLFTNGTLLRPRLSRLLAQLGNLESIVVNVPSADPREYEQLMGIPMSRHLIRNIDEALRCGLRVALCVNGSPRRASRNVDHLRAIAMRDTDRDFEVYMNLTHDRAGFFSSAETISPGLWPGKLGGCRRMFEHLHVSVTGSVFLCCQDYRKNHVFGNLLHQSLDDIMAGDPATTLRRQIFGAAPAPFDLLCRSCVELIRVPETKPRDAASCHTHDQ